MELFDNNFDFDFTEELEMGHSGPQGEGNTVSPCASNKLAKKSNSSEKRARATFYCFTFNNYLDLEAQFQETLKKICVKFYYGHEVGEHLTPHLQGFMHLKKRMRITEFNKLFNGRVHFEACKGSEKQNLEYCSKGTDIVTFGYPKPIKLIVPDRYWQKEIIDIITSEPNERTVHWYWEAKGGSGKSSFVKYCVVNHAAIFMSEGKYADIMYHVSQFDMDKHNLIMIDVPRSNGNHVSYKALEDLKNGLIFHSKYESGQKVFNSPHIFIFSNEEPDQGQLSADRWHIHKIVM